MHPLDAADPLAAYRDRFAPAPDVIAYLDGNSLGRPLAASLERLGAVARDEWGGRLIRGWDEGWLDLPLTVGDELGRVALGAAPGQVAIADSTSVIIYKLVRAALAARPERDEIVIDRDNFPTDRYIVEGIAADRGLTVRWVDTPHDGGVTPGLVAASVGPHTAVALFSSVAYRSAWLADVPAITRVVHDAGALAIWDLCHSAGVVPTPLDAWGVDLAVGCGYKYLNGGPGAPAFLFVAERHQPAIRSPLSGWMGHAAPFAFEDRYRPSGDIRSMLCGTPPILGLAALEAALDLQLEADPKAVEAKGQSLCRLFIDLVEARCAGHGLVLTGPRDMAERGLHVSFAHPDGYALVQALIARGVIGDFRDPDIARFGFSPLYLSHADVWDAVEILREILETGAHERAEYRTRAAVTSRHVWRTRTVRLAIPPRQVARACSGSEKPPHARRSD